MALTYEKQFTRDMAEMMARKANGGAPPRRRTFAAAKTPDTLTGWTVSPQSIDSDIKTSNKSLRARSREQALNNDYIKKYLSMNVSNIIGHNGVKLKMNIKLPDGQPDKIARTAVQDSWRRWGRLGIPTVDGMLSWLDVEKLVVRTVPQDGGILVRHVQGFPNEWGYAIQILDIDFIDTDRDNIKTREGNIIRMGVEKTPFGKPVAIWIFTNNPGDQSFFINQTGRRSVRIPIEELEYIFLPQRPMQTHGYPWVHSALISLKHLGLYREAEVIQSRISASKNRYITQDKDVDGDHILYDKEDDDGQRFDEVAEPGEQVVLPPGTKVEEVDPTHPNSSYKEFQNAVLMGAASGLDVSYVSLANDLTKVNFSSMRQGVLDERNMWRVLQQFYIQRLHERIFMHWLPMALVTDLATTLRLSDIQRLDNPIWRPRGWDWVDPQKDMTANEKAVALGLKSRSEISAERGRDFEEVLEELKEEKEAAEEAGVDISGASATSSMEQIVVETPEGDELNAD